MALDDLLPATDGEPVVRQVTRALRDAIVRMRLAPGEKLSEQAIARQFGVSRQPVREAFIRLAETGLVRIQPQRGTLVAPLSLGAVLDAHFIREAVECATVREAATRITPTMLRRLRTAMAAQRGAARDGDSDSFFTADEAFHRLIAEASGRLLAWRVVEDVKPMLDRIRFLNMQAAPRRALVLRQHTAIQDALARHDAEAAVSAMRAHLANVTGSLPGLVQTSPGLFVDADAAPSLLVAQPVPDQGGGRE